VGALLAVLPGGDGDDSRTHLAARAPEPPAPATTLPPTTVPSPPDTVPAPPPAEEPASSSAAPTPVDPGPPPATKNPRSTVALALHPTVDVYEEPGGAFLRSLENPLPSGADRVLLVTGAWEDWYEVLLPVRPNGSTGWVHRSDVAISRHDYSIVVELGAHRLTVFEGYDVLRTERIGVGTATTPTPPGLYYIKELIETVDPGGPYGPFAYGLSGFSEVLSSFGGGDGTLGLHGTNDPSSLGRDVSHGCIRMSNEAITDLAGFLPLGVPVEVRP
jgi:lipoprotein-anchoring transpeptidase ErfK/SrfK